MLRRGIVLVSFALATATASFAQGTFDLGDHKDRPYDVDIQKQGTRWGEPCVRPDGNRVLGNHSFIRINATSRA